MKDQSDVVGRLGHLPLEQVHERRRGNGGVVSRVKFDDGTLPGPPHPQTPLPQGGEGRVELTTLAPLGERVARRGVFISRGGTGEGVPSIVKSNVGHHSTGGVVEVVQQQAALFRRKDIEAMQGRGGIGGDLLEKPRQACRQALGRSLIEQVGAVLKFAAELARAAGRAGFR